MVSIVRMILEGQASFNPMKVFSIIYRTGGGLSCALEE